MGPLQPGTSERAPARGHPLNHAGAAASRNPGPLLADIRAVSDAPTPVNIFSHPYFNLAGVAADDASILDQVLTVNASHYVATNSNGAATGAFAPVAGTPLDFSGPHAIGERINGGWGRRPGAGVEPAGRCTAAVLAGAGTRQASRRGQVGTACCCALLPTACRRLPGCPPRRDGRRLFCELPFVRRRSCRRQQHHQLQSG